MEKERHNKLPAHGSEGRRTNEYGMVLTCSEKDPRQGALSETQQLDHMMKVGCEENS